MSLLHVLSQHQCALLARRVRSTSWFVSGAYLHLPLQTTGNVSTGPILLPLSQSPKWQVDSNHPIFQPARNSSNKPNPGTASASTGLGTSTGSSRAFLRVAGASHPFTATRQPCVQSRESGQESFRKGVFFESNHCQTTVARKILSFGGLLTKSRAPL